MKLEKFIKNYKLKVSDWSVIIVLIIYRIFLDVIYVNYVNPVWQYYHFNLDFNYGYTIISYFLTFLMSISVAPLIRRRKLSDITLLLLIVMYYIPYTSLFSLCSHDVEYMVFVTVYFLIMIVANFVVNTRELPTLKIGNVNFSDSKIFMLLIILLGVIIIAISGIYTGFRISFDLSDYYEYRAEAREYAMPEVLRYLYSWSQVGLNVGLVFSLTRKKKALSIYIILCNIFAFSFSGKKSMLFILILTIIISFFYNENRHLRKIPLYFLGVSGAAIVEMVIRGKDVFIAKHFIRRLLFIPPLMGTLFYDYFSVREKDYLRSSVLRRFGFVSPYGEKIPRLIGSVYFPNVGGALAMNANTGLCGDAFSNFGFWALLFVPVVIILTFKIIEMCVGSYDKKMIMVISILTAYTFINVAYFTTLLTDGFIFLCILMIFLNSSKRTNNNMMKKYMEKI